MNNKVNNMFTILDECKTTDDIEKAFAKYGIGLEASKLNILRLYTVLKLDLKVAKHIGIESLKRFLIKGN